MFRLDTDLQVYLHRNAVDFRLEINGSVPLVEHSMQDPFARADYAFHNRRRNRLKLLLWGRKGP
jgi:transposase